MVVWVPVLIAVGTVIGYRLGYKVGVIDGYEQGKFVGNRDGRHQAQRFYNMRDTNLPVDPSDPAEVDLNALYRNRELSR